MFDPLRKQERKEGDLETFSVYSKSLLYVYVCLNQWTHGVLDTHQNYELFFGGLKGFVSKNYIVNYVCLNQWTHGVLDTQQNNVYLHCTQWICHKKLYGYVCFKSVDAWTTGHTAK